MKTNLDGYADHFGLFCLVPLRWVSIFFGLDIWWPFRVAAYKVIQKLNLFGGSFKRLKNDHKRSQLMEWLFCFQNEYDTYMKSTTLQYTKWIKNFVTSTIVVCIFKIKAWLTIDRGCSDCCRGLGCCKNWKNFYFYRWSQQIRS